MEYVIQCRFSNRFASYAPVRELFPIAKDAVLFSFSFTHPSDLSPSEAESLAQDVLRGVEGDFSQRLIVDVDNVQSGKGSVVVTLLVLNVVLNVAGPAAVATPVIGVGGVALWAADKALGGTLSEFGKALAQAFMARISLFNDQASPIRDPQEVAKERAEAIARERGCAALPMAGGTRVRLSNQEDWGYKYSYQLVGAMPGYVTVVVDQYARYPVEYHVVEALPLDTH